MCGLKLFSAAYIVLEVCRSCYYGGAMCWDGGITFNLFTYLSNEDLSFCSSLIKVLKVL